jgi:hypothetical protein
MSERKKILREMENVLARSRDLRAEHERLTETFVRLKAQLEQLGDEDKPSTTSRKKRF